MFGTCGYSTGARQQRVTIHNTRDIRTCFTDVPVTEFHPSMSEDFLRGAR